MSRAGIVLVAFLAAIQTAFLPSLSRGGLVPNLLMVAIFAAALVLPTATSLIAGSTVGFWLDTASFSNFGIRMIWFCLFVIMIKLLQKWNIQFKRLWVTGLFLIIMSLLYNYWLLAFSWLDAGVSRPANLTAWWIEALVVGLFGWLFVERFKRVLQVRGYGQKKIII